jgi:cobalt-zinc-cadmium efflux system membrane fusion protein
MAFRNLLRGATTKHLTTKYALGGSVAAAAVAGAVLLFGQPTWSGFALATASAAAADKPATEAVKTSTGDPLAAESVELSEAQLRGIKVGPVEYRVFPVQDQAIGNIDFNEDLEVQVFTPYQGRIVTLSAKVGDDVQKGQTLFTIDSADLLQAESTLISAEGVLRLTTRALARAKELYEVKGIAQKDYDQAISDQQGAEASYRAAFDAVRIFGKSAAEIQKVATTHHIDSILVVPSPVSGRITARSAAPGLFVQPGNAPAPYTVADISTMWMLANVPESDIARYTNGQALQVTVPAYPGHVFDGRITTIGTTVDPNTRRVFLRSEIADPDHLLRSGMFASFVIKTGETLRSLAVPVDGVSREGDGTMTAWVTTDRKRFTRRTVKLGLQQNGYHQILEGLRPGELIAADGALFISNALNGVSE